MNSFYRKITFQAEFRLFKYRSNYYQEQFLPIIIDMCILFKNCGNSGLDTFSTTFLATIAKPLRKFFFAKGNVLPEKCPIKPVSIYKS